MTEQKSAKEWEEACICFPPDELPEFCGKAEEAAAAAVLCPTYGVRFHTIQVRPFIY